MDCCGKYKFRLLCFQEKLQLGINNSAKSQNPTITDLTSDTKQKLRDLRIKSKVASGNIIVTPTCN